MLYTYYGDDFTGSTDVLETLALAGVETVLFLGLPTPEHRAAFASCNAIGIAGDSRSRSPEWMSEHLPPIFETLKSFGAPIAHYKTCSTFDSSPTHGSIGRALEIGCSVFQPQFVPIVVGTPRLRRYVFNGNLFAQAGDQVYRIDRHPTMKQHPVTPMHEADLRKHLSLQTAVRVGLVDFRALAEGKGEAVLQQELPDGCEAVLFDGVDDQTLAATGELLLRHAQEKELFTVGSSGVSEALITAWRSHGMIAGEPALPVAVAVDQLLVVSGSCSPATDAQIGWALEHGFAGIALDASQLTNPAERDLALESATAAAVTKLQHGESVVLYTARGPLVEHARPQGEALGQALGQLIRRILAASSVRRVVLCGGDSSSHAVQQLGLVALTFAAPLTPGVPLCNAHSDDPALNGLQLVLKGGQIGREDFFASARAGELL